MSLLTMDYKLSLKQTETRACISLHTFDMKFKALIG